MDAFNEGRARFGLFELDLENGELRKNGRPIKLQAQPAKALALLVTRAGEMITRQEIQHHVWPNNFVEFDQGLNYCISQIRSALSDKAESPVFIETIPRQGYRFIAPVEYLPTNGVLVDDSAQVNGDRCESSLPSAGVSSAISSRWRLSRFPIAVVASASIALAAALYYFVGVREARPTPTIRSVAVLPFKLLGSEDEHYLGLGISDAVITKLSNLREVTVRPTRAVLKYEDIDIDPVAAGRELGVDSLLSGVVQRSGNEIRLTLQLTRVSDGASLWARKFEEDFADLFEVQDAISQRVAESLMPQISASEREAITSRGTENSEAYLLYMRGGYLVNKGTGESLRKGIEYFEKALALDANFAASHALIAWTYTMLGFNGLMPPDEAMPRARAALTNALELDSSNAKALTSQAFIKMHYDHDWPGAGQAFLRALDQNPQYLPARQWYAWWLLVMGREEESAVEMRRAYEIDPVTPGSSQHWGLHLLYSRRYEQSIEHHRSLIELEPGLTAAHWYLAITYSLKGMHEEAIAEGQRALRISEENKYFMAYIYSAAGRRAEAMKILAELKERAKTKYVSPYTVARIYAGLGEPDRAFETLERALREQDQKIFWLKVDPTFDSLREDKRYAEIMRKMKLHV
jgi:TolB-like protein/DNA-binding winged helix-turn-helix (wHTH) protein/Tfp pilus assembly protein PilF